MLILGIGTIIFFGWVGYRIKKAQREGRAEGRILGMKILKEHGLDPKTKKPIKRKKTTGNAYRDFVK